MSGNVPVSNNEHENGAPRVENSDNQAQNQLQQLTKFLVNAISVQQQQQQYAQIQQLVNAFSCLQSTPTGKNQKSLPTTGPTSSSSLSPNSSPTASGPGSSSPTPDKNSTSLSRTNSPSSVNSSLNSLSSSASSVQAPNPAAIAAAAAAVTVKHQQSTAAQNQTGGLTTNACTVQCIDPVTRRTVLYRPGSNKSNPQTQNTPNSINPAQINSNSLNGMNMNNVHPTMAQRIQAHQNNQVHHAQAHMAAYQQQQNVIIMQQLLHQQQQMLAQQHAQQVQAAMHQWQNQNRAVNGYGPNMRQGGSNVSPIGANRPRKLTNEYTDQSDYFSHSETMSRSSDTSGRAGLSPSNSPSPVPGQSSRNSSENDTSDSKKRHHDDDDILSELNRQIDLICFS